MRETLIYTRVGSYIPFICENLDAPCPDTLYEPAAQPPAEPVSIYTTLLHLVYIIVKHSVLMGQRRLDP